MVNAPMSTFIKVHILSLKPLSMANDSVTLSKRSIFIGFGLLLGLQLLQLWHQLSSSTTPISSEITKTNSDVTEVKNADKDNGLKDGEIETAYDSNDDLSAFIALVIQKEIHKETEAQTETIISEISNLNTVAQSPDANANVQPSSDTPHILTEKQQFSFESANNLIDEAISVGHWDNAFENRLASQLKNLPTQQKLEVRMKYAKAINDGLITPSVPMGLQ